MSEVKRHVANTLTTKLTSISDQTRTAALCELRLLTKTDPEFRPIIAQSGALPILAETLYSPSQLIQENGAATLLNISITTRDALMSTPRLLDAISHALSLHARGFHPSAVQSCAATVYSILVNEKYRPVIGAMRDVVYSLIDIVRCPLSVSRTVRDALRALFALALHAPNRVVIVELGVVEALFGVVERRRGVGVAVGLVEDATAVVAQVAGGGGGGGEAVKVVVEGFRKVEGVRVMMELVGLGSERTRENAVAGLLNLVRLGGEEVKREIREEGIEEIVDGLREVMKSGSEKGRRKAEALLMILEEVVEDEEGGREVVAGLSSGLDSGPISDARSY